MNRDKVVSKLKEKNSLLNLQLLYLLAVDEFSHQITRMVKCAHKEFLFFLEVD